MRDQRSVHLARMVAALTRLAHDEACSLQLAFPPPPPPCAAQPATQAAPFRDQMGAPTDARVGDGGVEDRANGHLRDSIRQLPADRGMEMLKAACSVSACAQEGVQREEEEEEEEEEAGGVADILHPEVQHKDVDTCLDYCEVCYLSNTH